MATRVVKRFSQAPAFRSNHGISISSVLKSLLYNCGRIPMRPSRGDILFTTEPFHNCLDKCHRASLFPSVTPVECSRAKRHFLKFPLTDYYHYLFQSSFRRYYTTKRKNYNFPQLKAEDLEESFVRGSGPGGQAVNQTANCVVLKHIPSGIVVKCQETRSLDKNRKIARMRLEEKLDFKQNGDLSYLSQQQAEHRKEKMDKRKKSKDKLAMKKAFKESLKDDLE